MNIGDKIIMNHYSDYKGMEGTIISISEYGEGFIIELENGLTLLAPVEVITLKGTSNR